MSFDIPKVMGILNITPDSFFSGSRTFLEEDIRRRVRKMIEEGADIIDVGGCSTRPGFTLLSHQEEWERVSLGCRIVREISSEIPLSIDTFNAYVAIKAIENFQVDIINDVSGGVDPEMFDIIAENKLPYVLTHNRKDGNSDYSDVTADVIKELSWKLHELYKRGVNDVIIDPGFGFAKTLQQNFILLNELNEFIEIGCPLLVGISRKSMIYKTLDCSPEESLTGSIALDSIALEKGANILRVHDVKEAKESVKLFTKLKDLFEKD